MQRIAEELIERIKSKQNVDKARWLENYVKHDVKAYGVGIPEIRQIVQQTWSGKMEHTSIQEQTECVNQLIRHEYTEPKLAAILIVQLYWKSVEPAQFVPLISEWFDAGAISDWNVCDWLCVRILTPLLERDAGLCVTEFRKWNRHPSIWKARASLVPFAMAKTIDRHGDVIAAFSSVLIQRDERFCKTAVGWVMREYSKVDATYVAAFLEERKAWLTKEVIKNATKYMGSKCITQ